MFKLPNEVYDTLKWVIMIVLPSVSVFVGAVGADLGFTNPETVVNILNAVTVMLGAWIGASTVQYQKTDKDGK